MTTCVPQSYKTLLRDSYDGWTCVKGDQFVFMFMVWDRIVQWAGSLTVMGPVLDVRDRYL